MIEKSQRMKSKHQGDVKPKYIVSTCFFVLMGILMFVQLVILLLPIAWAIMASFKDPFDFSTSPFSFPDIFCWDNYTRAFKGLEVEYWSDSTQQLVSYNFFNMFCNSAIYALISPAWSLLVTFCTSYLLARYHFFGSKFLYNFAILMMVLPFSASLSASLYLRKMMGIYDNIFAHIFWGASGFGFNFVLLYGNIKGLSNTYGEAAQIDGAGHYTIMFKIYFPMVLPLLFGLFLLAFISSWNDYNTFLVYLPSTPNLAYGTYAFNQWAGVKRYTTPEIMAACMFIASPSIILWIVCHKWSMTTMKVGGLKG